MNTFDPSFDPDCYRHIMTERRKIRRIKTGKEREELRFRKELASLWRQKHAIAPVPLEQPYQDGWMRFFTLEDDQKYDPKSGFYEQILREINTYQYSRNKSFTRRRIRKNRHLSEWAVTRQELLRIPAHRFNGPECRLTPEQKRLFVRVEKWHAPSRSWKVKYVFSEPWRFKLVVRPRMITEYFPVDNLIERRMAEIGSWFEERGIPLHERNWASKCLWSGDFHQTGKNLNELKNKPLHEVEAVALHDKTSLWEI